MKADPKQVKKLLATAKGQIEGIIKMVETDRYCIDISHQILASIAVLKKANQTILNAHLQSCVKESLKTEGAEKIDEIIEIINKLNE